MRKRIVWLVLCIMMVVSLLPISSAQAAPTYDVIRVRLSIGSVTDLPIFLDGNYSIAQNSSVQLERQLYTVKAEGSSLGLYYGSTRLHSGSTITLKQHAPTAGLNNFIYLNNAEHGYCRYLGDLVFTVSGGNIQAVNHVYLDDYLYGVVPHEMSDSWPAQALQAQAVAARSYAVGYIKTSGTYDLGDTSRDQVYEGYDPSYKNSIAAVNATAKQVVTYTDPNKPGSAPKVVTTYFSASNGGWTEIPLHNWSSGVDLPYYQIVEDPYDAANPYSLYETVFLPTVINASNPVVAYSNTSGTPNAANAVAYIKQAIVDSGKLDELGVTSVDDFRLAGVASIEAEPAAAQADDHTNADNHPNADDHTNADDQTTPEENQTISDESADTELPAEVTNEPISTDTPAETPAAEPTLSPITKSAGIASAPTADAFSLTGVTALTAQTPDTDDVYHDRHSAYSSTPCADLIEAKGTFVIDMGQGPVTVPDVVLDLRYFDASNGISTYKVFNNTSLRIFVVQAEKRNGMDGFSISHKRYGHGIGLSQRGAQQRANDGQTYDQILGFYYPGTELTTLNISKPALTTRTAPSDANATVTANDSVNVRSGPSTGYSALGKLPAGARIQVTAVNEKPGWHAFNYGGTTAYVSADYVNITGTISTITTAVNDPAYGTVTGGGTYPEGKSISVRAVPNDGYRFVRWQETGSASAIASVTVAGSRTFTAIFAPIEAVTLKSVTSGGNNATIAWNAVAGASSYEIYRSTAIDETYKLVGTVTSGTLTFADTGLSGSTTYYYKVRASCKARTATTYGAFSDIGSVTTPTLGIPHVTLTPTGFTTLRATWTAVPDASGYEVWYGTQKNGTYSRKHTSNSPSAGSWQRSGLTADKVYYVKVRAFQNINGEKVYSDFSPIQSWMTGRPSTRLSRGSSTSAKITWTSTSGAAGYEVWRGTQKYGTYSRKHTAKSSATSWTNTKLTTGKAYYYKVRAWRMVKGKKVYGEFSPIESIVP